MIWTLLEFSSAASLLTDDNVNTNAATIIRMAIFDFVIVDGEKEVPGLFGCRTTADAEIYQQCD